MEFVQYWVVPASFQSAAKKRYEKERIFAEKGEDWMLVLSSDDDLQKHFDLALQFNDDEGAAWGFALWVKCKKIASGLFGDNAETGVSVDDNFLEGDIPAAAKALKVDAKKLAKILEPAFPDSGKFAKLIGFPFVLVSSFEVDHALEKKKPKKKEPKKKKKKK